MMKKQNRISDTGDVVKKTESWSFREKNKYIFLLLLSFTRDILLFSCFDSD